MSDQSDSPQTEEQYDQVLNEVLKTLRAEYRQDLPARMDELKGALKNAQSKSEDALEGLKTAHIVAHRFAGTAGSYGFQNLSEAAQELDLYLKSFFQTELKIEEKNNLDWQNNLNWQKLTSLADKMQACIDAN